MSAPSIFDNAVAAVGAYFVADGVTDATENAIDNKTIEQSLINNLGAML